VAWRSHQEKILGGCAWGVRRLGLGPDEGLVGADSQSSVRVELRFCEGVRLREFACDGRPRTEEEEEGSTEVVGTRLCERG
jgi:hypothetical protein